MKWPLVTLESALEDAEVFNDGDWVESKDQDPEGDVRLIQLADVGVGDYLNRSARFLTSAKASELRCTFLKRGDVLVARMPDPLGRACVFPGDDKLSVTVVDVCVIRPNPKRIDSRWLAHCFNSPEVQRQLPAFTTGTTRSRISRGNLKQITIPTLPLGEQQRIAAILDQAEALRAKRRQALAKLDILTKSVFIEIFGRPGNIPQVEQLVPFGSGPLEIIDGDRGKAYPTADQFSPSGHCLFLSAKNVTQTGFDFSECQFISADRDRALGKGKLSRGDVVLTTRGTLGNTALYSATVPFEHVRINSGMLILRTRGNLRAEFLYIYLSSPHFVSQMRRVQSGSAQPQLPVRTLNEMNLLIPPVERQDECIAAFRLIEQHKQRLLRANELHEKLFASLQSRAFRGEL